MFDTMLQMLQAPSGAWRQQCGLQCSLPRYRVIMKILSVCLLTGTLVCMLPMPVFAAGAPEFAPSRDGKADSMVDPQTRRVQQRKDLRDALKPQQGRVDDGNEPTLANRHLTAQERAEMRQQLRQQRQDTGRGKP